jgi:hypothetical protein
MIQTCYCDTVLSLVAAQFRERLSVNEREMQKYSREYVNSKKLNEAVKTFSLA